jgi:AraC family transcriptional regulator
MEDVPRENGRLRREGSPVPAGLHEGVLDEYLSFRALKVFDGLEVARHRFVPGENEYAASFKGHFIDLHLSGPVRLPMRLAANATRAETEKPGDIGVYPAGVPFWMETLAPSEDLSVLVEHGLLQRVAEEAGAANAEGIEVIHRFCERDLEMESVLRLFLPELESGGLGGELYAQGLATALAVHLLRKHTNLGERARREISREPRPGGLSVRQLKSVLDFIGDNLGGTLTLAGMAREANLSPYHFSRLFKKSTGMSPHQYVIRERVERAKGLLLRGDMPVAAVAREVGFSDQGHLARHTKRLLGATPGEILKKRRAKEGKNLRKSGKILQDGAAPPA